MIEIRRGLGVALWITLVLISYDVARVPLDSIPARGGWAYLAEAARTGLLIYGPAAIVLILLVGSAAWILRRRSLDTGSSWTGLPLYVGAASAAFVAATALAVMGDRRGGAEVLSASWMADALFTAPGVLAAGWGAYRLASACAGKGALWLTALAVAPALPAAIAAMPVLAAAGLPGLARGTTPARPDLPDILLIVADTLRADALSCYGGSTRRTPALDALAAGGVRFADATAQASWTNPSTASLLTGVHPHEHGMVGYRGRIRPEVRTLAEALSARGYYTAGIVANLLVSRSYGFDRGFQDWDQEPDRRPMARHRHLLAARLLKALGRSRSEVLSPGASDMVGRALAVLSRKARAPRFLYLHLMDPHDPYTPPDDLAKAFDPGYAGSLSFKPGTLYAILRGEQSVDEEDLRHARALYDAEVAGMDREVGRLFDALRERIHQGEVIVVFTSDHGEEFMDHGALGHEHTLYQELVHVPLLIARPGVVGRGVVVREPVALTDVAPTILDLAGLPPEPAFRGRSLVPLMRGEEAAAGGEEVVFTAEDYVGYRASSHRIRAARSGALKVILYEPNVFGIGAWRRERFHLAADPGERDGDVPDRDELARLETRLREWMAGAGAPAQAERELDPETERRLRALGYIQ